MSLLKQFLFLILWRCLKADYDCQEDVCFRINEETGMSESGKTLLTTSSSIREKNTIRLYNSRYNSLTGRESATAFSLY